MDLFLPLAVAGLLVGLCIGAVGVGGVLLVPLLTLAFGVDIRVAIASCLFAYIFTGLAGAWLYARRGSIAWRPAAWLCLGAMPGAFAGASAVQAAPAWLLKSLIALLMVGAGLNALRRSPVRRGGGRPAALRSAPALAALGGAVGFGSALTGTGGPVMLVPLLLALGMPALAAVGLGQAMQVPVSLLATARNLPAGDLDAALGALLAASLTAGTVAGARLAHAMPGEHLARSVAAALVLFRAALLLQIAAGA